MSGDQPQTNWGNEDIREIAIPKARIWKNSSRIQNSRLCQKTEEFGEKSRSCSTAVPTMRKGFKVSQLIVDWEPHCLEGWTPPWSQRFQGCGQGQTGGVQDGESQDVQHVCSEKWNATTTTKKTHFLPAPASLPACLSLSLALWNKSLTSWKKLKKACGGSSHSLVHSPIPKCFNSVMTMSSWAQ